MAELIAERIRAQGGWIAFDAYMAMALYEPGLGYYGGGSRKLGAAGDFTTAPELSDLFGACLAGQCAQWFESCDHRVIEFGAGSGALAVQVLGELERLGFADTEYLIIELSGELAARQRERIARELPAALGRVRWLSAWPERFDGVVLANELLDALPVRAFQVIAGAGGELPRVMERGVRLRANERTVATSAAAVNEAATSQAAVNEAATSEAATPAFEWALRPAQADFAKRVLERLEQARPDQSAGGSPPECAAYAGEIGEQAEHWVTEAAARLARGAILLIDYGFSRPEYFHPQRSMGTLMCHYRHHAHGDPFYWPGLQDITAHVDFTAIAQAAARGGLSTLGFVSQARLLTSLGLLERLADRHRALTASKGPGDQLAWARQTQAVQTLLSEAEMGELFKAVAFGRDEEQVPFGRNQVPVPVGFSRGDRSARLLES